MQMFFQVFPICGWLDLKFQKQRIYNFEISIMSLYFFDWLCVTNFEMWFSNLNDFFMSSSLHFSCEWHTWLLFCFCIIQFHTIMILIWSCYIIILICCWILFASWFFVLSWILSCLSRAFCVGLGLKLSIGTWATHQWLYHQNLSLPFIGSFFFWFHLVLWLLPHIMNLKIFASLFFFTVWEGSVLIMSKYMVEFATRSVSSPLPGGFELLIHPCY